MKNNARNFVKRKNLFTKFIPRLVESFGEDPQREGLNETPGRVLRMYEELLSGYSKNPSSVFKTFKNDGYKDLVTVANINFYSLCEHHLIPFFGKVHIGYVPNGRILGFSKFARLVDVYARRLQTQENLTKQIFDSIQSNLHPKACIVRIEAEHLCVNMRGIKKKDFITKTTVSDNGMRKNGYLTNQFYKDIESNKI
ncbi:GTP cyclohydrolase I FolE [Candidatus Gottesmanbacteria bacterium RIFCSPLOWO2_01_FULL_46_21]|uniref:GTP cyclohydrolase 1 n=2 Tax=Microgenomates group TaxID=1794810 RepID=A0A0G0YNL8_9BACT|nr:MAG: GTP cyclohydrolase 1 [Candidatus Daviesbacteria bacterium GW2011_GWB1_41_5]OGG28734.1 MAG: GTP cyclohydrolase I FolE [Candidatus Gottesmanbacteria bacterium RIFCSPLOWO2_01_FULL_46_21]